MINNYRPRTNFTEHQKKVLEDFYRNQTKKPSEEQREQLGQKIGEEPRAIIVRTNILFQYINL